eukprot:2687568-Prorocentrum_lima.AAC.1
MWLHQPAGPQWNLSGGGFEVACAGKRPRALQAHQRPEGGDEGSVRDRGAGGQGPLQAMSICTTKGR